MSRWRQAVVLVAGLCLAGATRAQVPSLPKVLAGSIERLEAFPSRFIAARNIDVWLPEGYGPGKRYNVLYMQDGQMLFDPATTWNKQAWKINVALSKLVSDGRIPDTIVVGIWNRGDYRQVAGRRLPAVHRPGTQAGDRQALFDARRT